jgi:hypothetical protein
LLARAVAAAAVLLSASASVRLAHADAAVPTHGVVSLAAGVAARESENHVLLISVDGLHASDLAQWVAGHPDANLAALSRRGTTYANASSSTPSDSFPGLLALVTGGTPKTTGVFYDDAYARNLWAPGSACAGPPGAETVYDESIDQTDAGGNIPLFTSIDPTKLPMGKVDGKCAPIYPHSFLQTNTIFNVARAAGLYTAWSDKHPAYEIVNGPSGAGVNDLFTPEINNVNDPTGVSVAATAAYDRIKVQAILNEIHGLDSSGQKKAPVPAIFGMNFQAVSVGQKLVDPVKSCLRNPTSTCDPSYVPGGYLTGTLQFTPQLVAALTSVDNAVGDMVAALKAAGLSDSTEIILTAKHGQSPIDPAKLAKIGDPISKILGDAGIAIAQETTDDIALIWLGDQGRTAAAVSALLADKAGADTAHIDYILSGDALAARFGSPLKNARTPDLIVQPRPGTIYTKSKAKVAEHGGFAPDDTHVALLVVGPPGERGGEEGDIGGRAVAARVATAQVAPTILRFLGLDPDKLDSVRLEHTEPLPAAGPGG